MELIGGAQILAIYYGANRRGAYFGFWNFGILVADRRPGRPLLKHTHPRPTTDTPPGENCESGLFQSSIKKGSLIGIKKGSRKIRKIGKLGKLRKFGNWGN